MDTASSKSDAKESIKHAAYLLFSQKGCNATSYSDIAKASECGRPLVQYHFPKKDDLLVEFVLDAMNAIQKSIEKRGLLTGDETKDTLMFGQAYYAFLLSTDGMKRLTSDIMSNRDVTRTIIKANAKMTLPVFDQNESELAAQASFLATGGTYDLLHEGLSNEKDLDPCELALTNVAVFLAVYADRPFSQTTEEYRGFMKRDAAQKIAQDVHKLLSIA